VAGDTLNAVLNLNRGRQEVESRYPPWRREVVGPPGTAQPRLLYLAGGDAVFDWIVPGARQGQHCVAAWLTVDGVERVVASAGVEVGPAPVVAAPGGVYRVVDNHQLTCAENGWANQVHVEVRDAAGQPVPGQRLEVAWNENITRPRFWPDDQPLRELTTGPDGRLSVPNIWPVGSNDWDQPDMLEFHVRVAGHPSDWAVEISSGFWQTDPGGCTYCPGGENVWGHWSYQVVFQLVPDAQQWCKVPTDHAGQAACPGHEHLHHDPDSTPCWAVGR